jgi:hypothetical protein
MLGIVARDKRSDGGGATLARDRGALIASKVGRAC